MCFFFKCIIFIFLKVKCNVVCLFYYLILIKINFILLFWRIVLDNKYYWILWNLYNYECSLYLFVVIFYFLNNSFYLLFIYIFLIFIKNIVYFYFFLFNKLKCILDIFINRIWIFKIFIVMECWIFRNFY